MHRWILIASILLVPNLAATGDYERINTPSYIVENKGGKVRVKKQTPVFRRIYTFATNRYGLEQGIAMEFGMSCEQTPDPKTCAAIAAKESGFRSDAIGLDGELSAWQLLEPPPGFNRLDNFQAARIAMKHLASKTKEAKGNFRQGIRRYNGAGPKAEKYASDVIKLRRMI